MLEEELEKEKQCQKEIMKEVNIVFFTLYGSNFSFTSCLLALMVMHPQLSHTMCLL